MIVLALLKKPAWLWKTFVANRVFKISEVVSVDNWCHVESKYNPADIASRGAYPNELVTNKLWWFGPSWLQLHSSLWPITITVRIGENIMEMKNIQSHFTYFQEYVDPLNCFSSFGKALRVMAYVFRFIHKIRKSGTSSEPSNSTYLQKMEMETTRNSLIILSQKLVYSNEYSKLTKNEFKSIY